MDVTMESSSSSSSSDSEDELFLEFVNYERRPYVVKPRVDHFSDLDDVEFFTRFRLRKETVLFILMRVETEITPGRENANTIPPMARLLLTLRFYALGSMLITVGDFVGVSKPAACEIVRVVSSAIASMAQEYIKMPSTPQELTAAQTKFYQRCGLPRVVGALDCTHVKIQSPGGLMAEQFRNRKGYFSLNVQSVSSEDLQILNLVVRWPGSVHDQTIFNNSALKNQFERGDFGNGILLADCGYANTRYVATPLAQTRNAAERQYQEAVIRGRNPVEIKYGVWKRRFPVLSLGLRLKLPNAQAVVLATGVLHNIAKLMDGAEPPLDPSVCLPPDEIDDGEIFDGVAPDGNARDELIDYIAQR
ncbi:transposon protein [Nesidiocoris tenuis]|uniref:Transposon protein n=1 Tax=Nesidiocoris tenuis TaxID=355587 RepID=A0ABN7AFS7_9HEMI|nr:transposon protein [Nesidiocoris tenuis]